MDVPAGKEIDGYRILEVLGRGGMGIVYKAEDVALSRLVALKMIDPRLSNDESFLRRFRAEARALARIDSPYIVSVHALRQTDLGLFIVMEYVEGGTLADPISEGAIPWARALPLIKQVLLAFEHAHSVGVVHRDIKPSNIMLTPDGVVKVTDFGLAKLHQQNVEATVTQGIAGTLSYMSPEQVKGEKDLDHRSDLYSLGMTIYEMLAGRVPLDKSRGEFAVLKSIVEETPPPPVHYVPTIPEALNRVVMKALEKDPTRRYQSAREIIADIEAFETIPLQDPKGNAPDPIVAVGKPEKKVNRRTSRYPGPQVKAPLLFGAAAIIIVLAAVIFLLVRTWQADRLPSLLTVTSSPAGATVYLGDRVIGETPIRDHAVAAGLFHVRLQKSGFTPVDTTLVSETGRPLTISLELTSEAIDAGTAVGTITSIPDDAAVWINERPVGRTPYSLEEAAPDTLMIEVRKEGFRDWQQERNISPGESFTIAASLVPAQGRQSGDSDARDDSGDSGASAQRSGTLVVRADPGGHVEVDDRAVGPGGALTLAAGEHKITCGQAPRHFEENVLVSPDQTREVTCYFRSTVNIVSTMDDGSFPWASVWINGVYHDQTPTELKLDPGTYHIEVRRDGYRILDDEVVLDLTPALEPQTYPLVFRMAGE